MLPSWSKKYIGRYNQLIKQRKPCIKLKCQALFTKSYNAFQGAGGGCVKSTRGITIVLPIMEL